MSGIRRIYDDYYPLYFITAKTFNNRKIFYDEKKIKLLLRVIEHLIRKRYLKLFAWVILPDHFHLLLEIIGEKNISEMMHDLKSYTTNQISKLIITSRGAEASAPRGDKSQILVGEASEFLFPRRRGFSSSLSGLRAEGHASPK